MRYMVYSEHLGQPDASTVCMWYFKTLEEAEKFVHELMEKAENLVDIDGYPSWINDVTIYQTRADIISTPEGLQIREGLWS